MHWKSWVVATLLCAPFSAALAERVPPGSAPGPTTVAGDNPPPAFYTFMGTGGAVHSVAPLGTGGTFNIAGIPGSATIDKAFFITGIWDDSGLPAHSMNFFFAGTDYGTQTADIMDFYGGSGGLDLGGYLVDVTADVSGNGAYGFSAVPNQSGTGAFGSLLVVIYSDAFSPGQRIDIHFGAESLENDASTSSFAGLAPGPATLFLFTEADQAGTSAGEESISFNGAVVAGGMDADLFAANQGSFTSFFAQPVTAVAGPNLVTVTTGEDWLGWHYVALASPLAPTPTQETTWGALKGGYRD